MIIPKFPSSAQYTNWQDWAKQVEIWANQMAGEIERDSRDLQTPAKAAITLTNVTTPTTSLDGTTTSVGAVRDFVLGLAQTMIAKGMLRTKVGAS